MLVLIKTLHSILKLLNSETAPSQLAAGVAFGMIIGLTPVMTPHNLIIFFIVCLFRVNFSMFFISFAAFKILGFLLDPFWDWFGYKLLVDLKVARPFWIAITSGPILPYFKFNNTIVMGSLAMALILFVPVFLGSQVGVKKYRVRWRDQIVNSKALTLLKATPLFGLYQKYEAAKQKLGLFS